MRIILTLLLFSIFSQAKTQNIHCIDIHIYGTNITQSQALQVVSDANILFDDPIWNDDITINLTGFTSLNGSEFTPMGASASASTNVDKLAEWQGYQLPVDADVGIIMSPSFSQKLGAAFYNSGHCQSLSGYDLGWMASIDDAEVLVHELAHLFSANHLSNSRAIMHASVGTSWDIVTVNAVETFLNNSGMSCSACLATALPVELTFFEAKTTENIIYLIWQTSSELNNQGFEIHHSKNGETWEMIGFIQGNGTVYETKNYEFIDESPTKGINYYRLKQVDYDGQFEYSSIVSVFIGEKTGNNSQIFPNPATDKITISNCTGKVTLYNILGQPLEFYTDCTGNLELNIAHLEKGQYIVQILNENGEVLNLKFVKNN